MMTVEAYRQEALAADKERRRRKARLPYDEKLEILRKLRRAANTLRNLTSGSPGRISGPVGRSI